MGHLIRHFFIGFRSFMQGSAWLKEHPKHCILLIIPFIISTVSMVMGLGWLISAMDGILVWFWIPAPENWWTTILHYSLSALLSLLGFYIAISLIPIIVNILSAPLYDIVSCAIEESRNQREQDISIWKSLLVARDELIKVLILFLANTLLLLIPGGGFLTPILTAFVLGWNAFDYPFARRGWSLSRRWQHARQNFFAISGLGVWLMIPFLQIFFMPLAIAGGTILALDTLDTERTSS